MEVFCLVAERMFLVLINLKQQRRAQRKNHGAVACRRVAGVADIDQVWCQQDASEEGPVPVGFNLLAVIGAKPARERAVLLAAADGYGDLVGTAALQRID